MNNLALNEAMWSEGGVTLVCFRWGRCYCEGTYRNGNRVAVRKFFC